MDTTCINEDRPVLYNNIHSEEADPQSDMSKLLLILHLFLFYTNDSEK